MESKRQKSRGSIIISILILLSVLTGLALILVQNSLTSSSSSHSDAELKAIDTALRDVLEEIRELCYQQKKTDSTNFTALLQNGTNLLESNTSMEKFHPMLADFSYNAIIIDNNDGDDNNGTDSDGIINIRITAYKDGERRRTLDALAQIDPTEPYSPAIPLLKPSAIRACFETPYLGNNVVLDLDRSGIGTPINIAGDDHDNNGTSLADSSHTSSGFVSNGGFAASWYSDNSDDLVYLVGNGGYSGAIAVTESSSTDCTSYTALEEDITTLILNHQDDSRIAIITPTETNDEIGAADIIVFDASGGGLLTVSPDSGDTIVLGSESNPVTIVVKGKKGRCTQAVDQAFYGGLFSPCPYSGGDGTVRFAGNVTGYGTFINDSSTEINGAFNWHGYIHLKMGAGNIEAAAASSACTVSSTEPEATQEPSPSGKVKLCHIPPGNPDNKITIEVASQAVDAHLTHGDILGECEGAEPEVEEPIDCSPDISIPDDIGNVFEVKGNTSIIGSIHLNKTTGTAVFGGLTFGEVVNHNVVLTGSTIQISYSYSMLEKSYQQLSTLILRKRMTYSLSYR